MNHEKKSGIDRDCVRDVSNGTQWTTYYRKSRSPRERGNFWVDAAWYYHYCSHLLDLATQNVGCASSSHTSMAREQGLSSRLARKERQPKQGELGHFFALTVLCLVSYILYVFLNPLVVRTRFLYIGLDPSLITSACITVLVTQLNCLANKTSRVKILQSETT